MTTSLTITCCGGAWAAAGRAQTTAPSSASTAAVRAHADAQRFAVTPPVPFMGHPSESNAERQFSGGDGIAVGALAVNAKRVAGGGWRVAGEDRKARDHSVSSV